MKNSRLSIFLAGMNIASIIGKVFTSIDGGWMLPQGWVTGLIIDILAVYIIASSTIKHKWVYVLLGAVSLVSITCLLATLAMVDIVHLGW